MPRAKRKCTTKSVESLRHQDASRKNIPTAEYQAVMAKDDRDPIKVAYERRNRDLDPQLVWRGKDVQDWSDLVVQAPPLFIQEKVHPKVLIDDLRQRSKEAEKENAGGNQADLFADFNGLPSPDAQTEFYQHDANWSNRMILGDSLQVMASLAGREGLRGKVQCIYIDPPYGIKFNSNFQWSTTSRNVTDGKADHITREPEQVKAFRDTWRDGVHSYLTHLRDRLTVARDLLADSGSVFVQIGDENVHRVRMLMAEVFGEENFVSEITISKTTGFTSQFLPNINDFVIWYAKNSERLKFRRAHHKKSAKSAGATKYKPASNYKGLANYCISDDELISDSEVTSEGSGTEAIEFCFQGREYLPPNTRHWTVRVDGLKRVDRAGRIIPSKNRPRYIRFLRDFPILPVNNIWTDIGGIQSRSDPKVYVVQSAPELIKRCILMTTDPGDLVLDPTCGSGTTAYVAEEWGRRWITIDTSRVALALARARIMGARYPYYLLADSHDGQIKEAEISGRWSVAGDQSPSHGNRAEGALATVYNDIRQGFVYERVPHITLKSIANNTEIDVIWEEWQETIQPLLAELSRATGRSPLPEWEIPRDLPNEWPPEAATLHEQFWTARIARQKEIDASIAAKAAYEFLYDKPYEDKKKVRVAGPFTVESLSPHRLLGVDESDALIDNVAEAKLGYGEKQDFAEVILDNLKNAGVQQAHKEDRIYFSAMKPWPGDLVCAEGTYTDGSASSISDKRAGIFIGPEFGTVSRPDLVEAAREAADADFDVLIACAFNYDAHATEFNKVGRIPVLKARMNADLHMADDLKNTGKGNLFVIFGEPDITVASGQWLVTSKGRMVANYEYVEELSGVGSLEEINRLGRGGLSALRAVSAGGEIRPNQPNAEVSDLDPSEHRGGSGATGDEGVPAVSGDRQRVIGRDGDPPGSGAAIGDGDSGAGHSGDEPGGRSRPDAQRSKALAALKDLSPADFPLSLTTDHWSQVTVNGVDVFHPNSGEIRSDNADGIACWFVDTDYNEESFFVRHAYFLGANDPYKSLKTTLKAEINQEAWETLHSDTSRPFPKPSSGRIAVKVINHLGDEVMKVFRV